MSGQRIYKSSRGGSRRSRPEMVVSNERLDFGALATQLVLGFRVVRFAREIK